MFDQGVGGRAQAFRKVGRTAKKRVKDRERFVCDRAQIGPGLPLEAATGKRKLSGTVAVSDFGNEVSSRMASASMRSIRR